MEKAHVNAFNDVVKKLRNQYAGHQNVTYHNGKQTACDRCNGFIESGHENGIHTTNKQKQILQNANGIHTKCTVTFFLNVKNLFLYVFIRF